MNVTRCQKQILVLLVFAFCSPLAVGDDKEHVDRVCTVIESMGAAVECAVNESEHVVDITTGDSVADAAQFCSAFTKMVSALTYSLSAGWKMRIFTPDKSDIPAAVCDLN